MIARVCGGIDEVYPLAPDIELRRIASAMPHATIADEAIYHIDRYDEGGLFGDEDPAERPLRHNEQKMKEIFPLLASVRNALIISGRISGVKS